MLGAAITAAALAKHVLSSPETIDRESVVKALESTGYELAYRRTPAVEGYDTIAGRARNERGGRVDFVVVLKHDGTYSGDRTDTREGLPPQPPAVRYASYEASTIGNAYVEAVGQSALRPGYLRNYGRTYLPTNGEYSMETKIQGAVYDLFPLEMRVP